MHKIAGVLSEIQDRLILLNGAGSFGHIPVKQSRLDKGFSRTKIMNLAATKLQLLRLQEILMSVLCSHKIPVVPFLPSSFMEARSGRLCKAELSPIQIFSKLGLIPLFGGDLVPDLAQGWSVVSADQMASYIAARMGASMIVYGTDVDGLYCSDPKTHRDAEFVDTISCQDIRKYAKSAATSRTPDVTAGMQGKLFEAEQAARNGVRVVIMNLRKPENILSILDGKRGKWTTILPDE